MSSVASPSHDPTPASVTPTPAPPDWTLTGSFGAPDTVQFAEGIVYWHHRFLAVGMRFEAPDFNAGPPPRDVQIWESTDGATWQTVPDSGTEPGSYFSELAVMPDDSLLATGSGDDVSQGVQLGVAAWQSADGQTWRSMDSALDPSLYFSDAAAGPKGVVVAGTHRSSSGSRAEIWHSFDGVTWELVFSRPNTDEVPAGFVDIAAGREGFVVTGYSRPGEDFEVFVAASADGLSWFEAPDQVAIRQMSTAAQVAAIGGDWVIAGAGDPSIPIWYSTNGLDWTRRADVDVGDAGARIQTASLVSIGDSLVLSAERGSGTPFEVPGGMWTSNDGQSWRSLDLGPGAFARTGATGGGVVVLAGNVGDREAVATMWTKQAAP